MNGAGARQRPIAANSSLWCRILLVAIVLGRAASAQAFGAEGHRFAGNVAERMLCDGARTGVARYGRGRTLAEVGVWADRIRSRPTWAKSVPWHFINIPDNQSLLTYRSPDRGDVLWAIAHFRQRLSNRNLQEAQRAEALHFLVHFVVDVHQPLHVGRASDRGGNAVAVMLDDEPSNLHRLWDSGIIERHARTAYLRTIGRRALAHRAEWADGMPRDWAAESQALRPIVYDFDGEPNETYLMRADNVLQDRLAQAAVRLAATLNRIFCAPIGG